jgi:hypothetical protein
VCGACTGAQLGDFCTLDSDCCNYPTVTCQGLEFKTCMLAP